MHPLVQVVALWSCVAMSADDYSRTIARVAVAQIAEQAGYEAVQDSAVEVLAELLLRYISEASAGAHQYAELANRTDANIGDVISSLEDLGTSVSELQAYLSVLLPVRSEP